MEAEKSRQAYLGELQDGMYVTVQGQLAGKQIQKNRYVYELTSCMFRTDSSNFLQTEPVSCGGVLIYSDSDDCSIGDILIYHGEITLWKRASNEGAFDAKAYYFARGFDFAMEGPALDRKVCAKRQTAEALWQLGQRIKEVYLKTMGERDAGYWRRWSSAIGSFWMQRRRDSTRSGDCRTFWRFPDFISL